MTMVSLSDSVHAYHLLEAALALYGHPPSHLDAAQTTACEERAREAARLESLILASPEAAGLALPEARVEAAWEEMLGRYETPAECKADMGRNGLTETSLRAALRRALWAEHTLEAVASAAKDPAEAEIRAAYEARSDKMQLPDSRTARHILITINSDFPENTPEQARKRADALMQKLGPTPRLADVEAAVARHSECPSAMEGGVIGLRVTPGILYANVDEMLFSLPEGGLGGPVESELGLHLVYCERINPAGPVPYEEIAPKLRTALITARQTALKKAWIARLRQGEPPCTS